MKKIIFPLFVVAISFATISCEKINDEPPRTEGVFLREFKMPDPKPLTAEQSIELRAIKAEYEEAMSKL